MSSPICPHCNAPLQKWRTPSLTNWEAPFLFVCFSDDCPYFRRSAEWMSSQFNVSALYRHRFDPTTGETGPLPVWSKDALKDAIIPDEDDSEGKEQ